MTIKELEILSASDALIDLIVYARCQLLDLDRKLNIPDLRCEHSKLHDTYKSIKDEIDRISPNYKPKCIYRR